MQYLEYSNGISHTTYTFAPDSDQQIGYTITIGVAYLLKE